MNYVYLLQEREFIRLEEDTYKIGKTTQKPNSRLSGYPKGSKVIIFFEVDNCHEIEKQLIEEFDENFEHMSEYGREYYSGNLKEMKQLFGQICLDAISDSYDESYSEESDESYSDEPESEPEPESSEPIEVEETVKDPSIVNLNMTVVLNQNSNQCNKCGKTFKEKRYLTQHLQRITPCDQELQCKKCFKIFKKRQHLESHMKRKTPCSPDEALTKEDDNPRNLCNLCNTAYSSKSNLTRHQKTCTGTGALNEVKKLKKQNKKLKKQLRKLT